MSVENSILGDFHTHSIHSRDGGLDAGDYAGALINQELGVVAITDHNVIGGLTLELARLFGNQVIVGEEITTLHQKKKVEIIGLYLREEIEKNMGTLEAARAIREQGGLIYVPHPYVAKRKGASDDLIRELHAEYGVDIIETYNGRSWSRAPGKRAAAWAAEQLVATASGSDAHGPGGWGWTYNALEEIPTRKTLVPLLARARPDVGTTPVSLRGRLHPKINTLRSERRELAEGLAIIGR